MPVKILVVDDEPQVERLIRQRLWKRIRSGELDFTFATDGREALDIIHERPADIILTDINMPGMDGLTFIAELQRLHPLQKTVMVSAYGDMKNIRTAMNRGAYDFITKPIDFEDLEITINKAIKEVEVMKLGEATRHRLDELERELSAASEVQYAILPNQFAVFSEDSPYSLFAKMIPAREVGGDFYDFFKIGEQELGIVIGDVAGKGMPAALFMAVSRTLIRTIAMRESPCDQCLEKVNYLLSLDNPASLFVTLFYGVINLETGLLTYCNAGHNPSFIVDDQQEVRSLGHGINVPLGLVGNSRFTSQRTTLSPGSTLFLYTDGVTEAQNEEKQFFTEERLLKYLKTTAGSEAREIVEDLIIQVMAFGGATSQSDDVTTLVLQRRK